MIPDDAEPPRGDQSAERLADPDAETVIAHSDSGPPAEPSLVPTPLQKISAYEVLGPMGGGGMGIVYRARDIARNQIVALKTLSHVAPESFAKLKREFRAAADIAHPNLVTLHELLFEDGVPYFTMELVEGTDFVTYVRGEPPSRRDRTKPLDDVGVQRLREASRQLALGLSALHAAGKLHRDIKPTNVMVTAEGRVVILDFGLALDADPNAFDNRVVGTPAYMAPEQTSGNPIGPAADWYAVGVMLYRALTGRLPYGRTVNEMVRAIVEPPPRPSRWAPSVPDDLDALCAELLAQVPDKRPAGAEVLARLGVQPELVPVAAAPLVGREAELSALTRAYEDACAGRTVVVRVEGPSGAGKSVLVRDWLSRLDSETIVLSSRCHERESFSFKALDGIVEGLVEELRHLPLAETDEWLGEGGDALARLFPSVKVLLAGQRALPAMDPQSLRRRGFRALKRLFAEVAAQRPLVLWIDDLQWCDTDSIDLLAELWAPSPQGPSRALWLAASRSEVEAAHRRTLAGLSGIDVRTLALDALSEAACAELAVETLRALGPRVTLTADELGAMARESRGNPLLLDQLVRDAWAAGHARTSRDRVSLQEVVLARVERLTGDAQRMLEVVAVAGGPIAQRVAIEVAAPDSDPWSVVATLRSENLARTHGTRGWEEIETWHDGIRESIRDHIAPDALAGYHAALAHALAREAERAPGRVDPAQLAEHFYGAGALDEAGRHAIEAARRASSALAFDRAAKLYALARRCGAGDATELMRLEADALVHGGHCADAAPLYLSAAERVSASDEALELRRLAAEQLLVSGRVDDGVALLEPVLAASGVRYPKTPAHAIASLVWQLAKLELARVDFRARAKPDSRLLRQIDLCWSAGKGLLSFDSLRAAHFLFRMLSLSLRAGEPQRASRALAMVGMMLVFAGDPKGYAKGSRMIEAAERAAPPDDRLIEGTITICRGTAEMSVGGFVRGKQLLERGIAILEGACTGIRWECSAARSSIFTSLTWIGDVNEMAERAAEYRRNAEQVGDLFLGVTAEIYGAVGLLAKGRPTPAREACQRALRRWAQHGYHYQHWLAAKVSIWCDLYDGQIHSAVSRCDEAIRRAGRAGLLRVQLMEIDALLLHGRVTVAAHGDRGARLRRLSRHARRLEGLDGRLARAAARHLRALEAMMCGDERSARRLYREAAERFADAEAEMWSLVAARLGAPEDTASVDAQICARGVIDPARWSRLFGE